MLIVEKKGRFCAFGPVEAWLKSASAKRDLGERPIIILPLPKAIETNLNCSTALVWAQNGKP
jgi:hypothetical protein